MMGCAKDELPTGEYTGYFSGGEFTILRTIYIQESTSDHLVMDGDTFLLSDNVISGKSDIILGGGYLLGTWHKKRGKYYIEGDYTEFRFVKTGPGIDGITAIERKGVFVIKSADT